MDRNALKKNFKDLIIIEVNGEKKELWGLVKAARTKQQQYQADQDYIEKLREQMESTDLKVVEEAKKALIFLNAYMSAELDGNFNHLAEMGVSTSKEFRQGVYESRNSAQRDFINNNQGSQVPLDDLINPNEVQTLGGLLDASRTVKRNIRKGGGKVSELYKSKKLPTKPEDRPLPVKQFSKEEVAKLNSELKSKKESNE